MASAGSEGVPIPVQRAIGRRKSRVLQSSLDLVQSFSRSQQLRYGKLALGSAPSFAFTARSPEGGYGATDGDDFDDEEFYEDEYDEEALADGAGGEAGDDSVIYEESIDRRSSGFFFSDPVHGHGHGHGHDASAQSSPTNRYHPAAPSTSTPQASRSAQGDRVRRSFAPGLFNFTPTPGNRAGQSAITFDDSIVHDVEEGQEEDDGLLSPTRLPREVGQANGTASEGTPLLQSSGASRRRSSAATATAAGRGWGARRPSGAYSVAASGTGIAARRMSESRRSVRSRRRSVALVERGESTDGQTLFNAVAVLVGIGILSLPLALAYMGWIMGVTVLFGFGAITCFTAFGPWAGGAITLLLALIVLFGDSLSTIFPSISSTTFKLVIFVLIVPTTLTPLKHLSLPSLLSTFSNFILIGIILVDGLGKSAAPGSLRHPQPTSWTPNLAGANFLGGWGFVLAGFGGHAVIPSLARDMKHPEHFDRVINKAFTIATGLGFIAGAAGYLMIGNGVSDEITRDLMEERYGFPRWLNIVALWMIALNPLTKFGLCSRPFNHTLESILGINRVPFRPAQPNLHAGSHAHAIDGGSAGGHGHDGTDPSQHLAADSSRISRMTRQSFSSLRSSLTAHAQALSPGHGQGHGPGRASTRDNTHARQSIALSPSPSRSPNREHPPSILSPGPGPGPGHDTDEAHKPLLLPDGSPSDGASHVHPAALPLPLPLEDQPGYAAWRRTERLKLGARVVSRTTVTACCTAAAILIPGFERVMAFLGSFNAFLICVILPVSFYLALAPQFGLEDPRAIEWKTRQTGLYMLLFVSVCMMTAGTTWAFRPRE